MVTYKSEDDVWEMIKDLYKESEQMVSDFSAGQSILDVFYQLPYFCCNNIILNQEIQEDIQRYVYCDDTNTQPYPGGYGDVQGKWMEIHFLIKSALKVSDNEYKKNHLKKIKEKNKGING